jgi:predicted nucleotidyltransferase
MEYLQIAEEFAKIVWPYKENIKIKDIMLFGSVAYKKQNPSDLDILLLHYNKIFDDFQRVANSKKIKYITKFYMLSKHFQKDINLLKVFQGTSIEKLISQNKFNVKYMNIKFFTNDSYKSAWIKKDMEIHKNQVPKSRIGTENFEDAIFRQGLLWNYITEKYDIPARKKYIPNPKKHMEKNL